MLHERDAEAKTQSTLDPREKHMPDLVTGVDFICVSTKDLAAAREWYENVLGLERSKLWRDSDPMGAEFETGSLTIALLDSEKLGMEPRPNNHPIALHVDDVDAARAELESRGVSFQVDTVDSGVCHMAYFKDPEGNALMLHHRYAPADAGPDVSAGS
jgi:catechol 2,3-dioxygenase-like lactoylglutathione lyase family enzyme